jgi:uncharacterized protein DUF5317
MGHHLLALILTLGGRNDLRSHGFAHEASGYRTASWNRSRIARTYDGGVLLLASILAIGLLFGWGFGGALRNIAHVRVVLWFLFPVALLLQAAPVPRADSGVGRYLPFIVLELSYLVLIVAAIANWRLQGFRLILVGLLLNAIPITLNLGMPVSGSAVLEAGGRVGDVPTVPGAKHHLARSGDRLTFLGDVIPVRTPFRTVVSVGDIAMYAGVAWFVAAAMLGQPTWTPRPRAHPGRPPQPSTMWESPP